MRFCERNCEAQSLTRTSCSWDNRILLVELLLPNKSDALAYLDSGSKAPTRYARALLLFGATLEPYLQEYQVGPLPVSKGSTHVSLLDYPFNKGKGYQRIYDLDYIAIAEYNYKIGTSIKDITKKLLNGVSMPLLLSILADFLT